jgi:site-specific DNA-cytosine methylase
MADMSDSDSEAKRTVVSRRQAHLLGLLSGKVQPKQARKRKGINGAAVDKKNAIDDAIDSRDSSLKRGKTVKSMDLNNDNSTERGPVDIEDTFNWAHVFIERIAKHHGSDHVKTALSNWRWKVSTSFSGIGCPEVALECLQHAATKFLKEHGSKKTPKLTLGSCIEKHKPCHVVLRQRSRCVFADIMETVIIKPDNVKIPEAAHCVNHGQDCALQASQCDVSEHEVEVAGPPCIFWSRIGKGEGTDAVEYKVHEAWHAPRAFRQEPIFIMENVVEYPESLIIESLGDLYDIRVCRFDPRHFGLPAARPRVYAVGVHRAKAKWKTEDSLATMLSPLCAKLQACADIYYFMEDGDAKAKAPLVGYMQKHLAGYKDGAKIMDLSQNPMSGRGRTETTGNALPTLTTNSRALYHKAYEPSESKYLLDTVCAV